jgi:uncharacterized protein YdeI (YjbR/CyaY-like superfamily)
MPVTDPRVDAYIARQADFARPILAHLRTTVHGVCPDTVEAIKWSMPFFTYKGRNLANMAGFKAHVAFGLWQGGGMAKDAQDDSAMGQFGRITSLADLPSDDGLATILQTAMRQIESGEPARAKPVTPKPPLPVPPELEAAIAADSAAAGHWSAFTPGKIRDYAEWIGEAKRLETRERRIIQAVEWIAEGKERNWKYRSC